ncbi:MAG: YccF domain-containing protein [Sulfuriferula sp.]
MSLIGNIIWFVFGGFVMGLAWWFAALLAAITIIGIPWAIAAFRIGTFSFWPFGRQIVERQSSPVGAAGAAIGNLIWALLAGWWLALGHLIAAALCAVTIIGIPFAFQHLKLASLSFFPFGKEIVTVNQY